MISHVVHGEVRSYAEVPSGARIVAVNGREVAAICECCGKPIFEDTDYYAWEDGVYTCKKHGPPAE